MHGVVGIGILAAAVEGGGVRRDLQMAARTVTQFGLPVILPQLVQRLPKRNSWAPFSFVRLPANA